MVVCYIANTMDNLLLPLEQLEKLQAEDAEEIAKATEVLPEVKIPIPNPSYLLKESKLAGRKEDQTLTKYAKEYEDFCEWSSRPKELRKPKTAVEWERKNLLPKGYSQFFKQREDYSNKRLQYFWDWMMDLYPDVVYAVYQRASNAKGSDKAAGIFIDLLSKKMNLDKPKMQIQPMVLMGVPQDKIDALFVPKDYSNPALVPEKT